jgi:hypothetical protein
MGIDYVAAYALTTPRFTRDAVRELIVDLWQGRKTTLASTKWSAAAARANDRSLIGYALSPVTERGWVAIVESANLSVELDQGLLERLGAATTAWVTWCCDHSALYGEQRLSKKKSDVPLDDGGVFPYRDLRNEPGWTFLTFTGVPKKRFPRFGPDEDTRRDVLPRDVDADLVSDFADCVRQLDLAGARQVLSQMRRVDESAMLVVFDESYPIEWRETAEAVLDLGAALFERRKPSVDEAVRYLEVAAVRNDARARDRARAALDGADRTALKAAVARANERFGDRARAAATKRFASWLKTCVGASAVSTRRPAR